ncbi:MAG: 3-methyl-2-oxobutanoate dehydrogenase subunit VorB [Bacteroidales bacterium]|jgi:2-oxoglutarate ferredoxin oxidoreductase subunit alpha|nr:3-methyl-2-oxobutanoate dehydrogenase subunit VorB [Bacteroidales bacterium]MCK9499507.1 3-methyl-2-oxobutanoate dehydrogenase subunit VorB [Bacteroidales bacterium]MDY0314825.1 3-methyl-2-oxobutanoate dehydrogenase subunit VorB [Bacteroidales bacterium]NLB86299.1 3-methyl-2-oxobutanoate dehydrogenase subunit VorB [Bacteroidales bacterium]
MEKELRLMKGNEAVAEAAIRSGADAYFGYPITPQSEVLEHLMLEKPHERTGMVVLQAESEVSAINMVYGAAGCGRMVMTSSSSPGISLKQEGISYIAGAELPCLILNVVRGGPGLGTIQPAQSDYFQSTKGGGHGDYRLIVLAPASVQEMYDFVELGFNLAFKYRNPVMIQSDGIIGQMMEKLEIGPQKQRRSAEEIAKQCPWATVGKPENRERNIITSLDLVSARQEQHNHKLQAKYKEIQEKEVRYELINCDDAEYIIVSYGSSARLSMKAMDILRAKGVKVGILRLITLFPYPTKIIQELTPKVKGFLAVEMSCGQMVEDLRLAVEFKKPVEHFGRVGGMVPSPEEIVEALEQKIIGG